jgi:hypothetical protein
MADDAVEGVRVNEITALSAEAQAYVARITERWRASVEMIIDAGRILIEAKAQLAHGEFGAMCETSLPFTQRVAQALMAIARDHRLQKYSAKLPPSWGTLYEMTKLSDDDFVKAEVQGLIRPDVPRWMIEGFQQRAKREAKPYVPTPDDFWRPSLGPSDVRRWTIAQVRVNARRLQRILEHAGASSEMADVSSVISDAGLQQIWGDE